MNNLTKLKKSIKNLRNKPFRKKILVSLKKILTILNKNKSIHKIISIILNKNKTIHKII